MRLTGLAGAADNEGTASMFGWNKHENEGRDADDIAFDDEESGETTAPASSDSGNDWFGSENAGDDRTADSTPARREDPAKDSRRGENDYATGTAPAQASDNAAQPADGPTRRIMASANAAEGDVEDDGVADAGDEPDPEPEPASTGAADDRLVSEENAKAPNASAYCCPYILVKADDDAFIPHATNPGDAGFDLVAAEDALIPGNNGRAVIDTGIALAIPRGFAGLVMSRSGMAAKRGLAVLNAPGLIDSGYRDNLKVILINTGHDPQRISRGDRIAQLVIQAVEDPPLLKTDSLPSSERGKNGLGSTGD